MLELKKGKGCELKVSSLPRRAKMKPRWGQDEAKEVQGIPQRLPRIIEKFKTDPQEFLGLSKRDLKKSIVQSSRKILRNSKEDML